MSDAIERNDSAWKRRRRKKNKGSPTGITNADDIEDLLTENVNKRDGEDENTIIPVSIGQ